MPAPVTMNDPVALATLFTKPTPVGEEPVAKAAAVHAKVNACPAEQHDGDASEQGPIAPYQAKPISGPISRNYTPALEVMENHDLTQQVRSSTSGRLGGLTHRPARACPPLHHHAVQDVEERIETIINSYKKKLADRTLHHMGYPYNLDFEYGPLEGLQSFMINNLGDPFIESNYGVHSREFEVRSGARRGAQCGVSHINTHTLPKHRLVCSTGLPNCGKLIKMIFGDTSPIVVQRATCMASWWAEKTCQMASCTHPVRPTTRSSRQHACTAWTLLRYVGKHARNCYC